MLAALFHRERTGEGQFVEVPMFESVTSFMMVEHLAGATFEPTAGTHGLHAGTHRRPQTTQEQGWLYCGSVAEPGSLRQIHGAGRDPDAYESDRFVQAEGGRAKVAAYYAMMREAALAHTTEEWMKLGDAHRIPIMRANTLEDVLIRPTFECGRLLRCARASERRQMARHASAGEILQDARLDPTRAAADWSRQRRGSGPQTLSEKHNHVRHPDSGFA